MTYVKTHLKREIVINSIITIHYFEYIRDFIFHGEAHDFWEFAYVDKGSVRIQAGEEQYLLHAGDIIFHEPNEFHAIESVGNTSPNLVAVSFVTHSSAMQIFRQKRCTLTMEERTLISKLISIARETLATPMNLPSIEQVKLRPNTPFGSEQLILLYLELFLITVARNHGAQNTSTQSPAPTFSPERAMNKSERMEKIIEYMEFHICEQLTITDICEAHSLSRSALQALFHNCLLYTSPSPRD